MKVGIQLPEVEWPVRWRDLAEMSRLIEDSGFDSIWVGDHLLYRDSDGVAGARGPWEAWSLLAAIGAITNRVEIGPLVAATAFHAPAMLAKKAATVDEISGGRLILGLGAGWNKVEFEAFGFAHDRRVSRFEEALTIIRTLIREGRIDFQGAFYTVEGGELLPRGPRGAGLPLMIGSTGPRMLSIALPHVDLWNGWFDDYDNDPSQLPAVLASIDAACEAAGRPEGAVSYTVAHLLQFGSAPQRRNSLNPVTGPPTQMADSLHRIAGAGVEHVQLVLDPITIETVEAAGLVLESLRA